MSTTVLDSVSPNSNEYSAIKPNIGTQAFTSMVEESFPYETTDFINWNEDRSFTVSKGQRTYNI